MTMILYFKIKMGYTFKIVIDILVGIQTKAHFKVDKSGFYYRATDRTERILVDIVLNREKMFEFKCENPMEFMVSLKHLQKMTRSIKRKVPIIIYVKNDWFCIETCTVEMCGVKKRETNSVSIYTFVNTNSIGLPDDEYNYPYIVESSDFLKLKKMLQVNPKIDINMYNLDYISFYSDNGSL